MSQPVRKPDHDYNAKEYLSALQALCLELRDATISLATDEASTLFEQLDKLEFSYSRMHRSRQSALLKAASSSRRFEDSLLTADQIRGAHLELGLLIYRFSALLRRRQRSVDLLSRHYQSIHTGMVTGLSCTPDGPRLSAEV